MANHNPIGDSRTVAAEPFSIDRKHLGKALQVSTELSLTPGWEVLQVNHQAYVAGEDRNPRPLEPMDKLQVGMIGASDGKRLAVNVSVAAARQSDDALEEPEIVLTLALYADGELLETFTKKRNRLPASFYAELDIAVRQ